MQHKIPSASRYFTVLEKNICNFLTMQILTSAYVRVSKSQSAFVQMNMFEQHQTSLARSTWPLAKDSTSICMCTTRWRLPVTPLSRLQLRRAQICHMQMVALSWPKVVRSRSIVLSWDSDGRAKLGKNHSLLIYINCIIRTVRKHEEFFIQAVVLPRKV